MKVALVHDYIKEFGGAERVLQTLSEMYPDAPIYTAFRVKNSTAGKAFEDKRIVESKWAPLLKIGKLYSPLRFLIPWIWGSINLSDYDLVITSASWYITRGFKVSPKTKVVCYCHTPPRWLYGYETSVGFTKYWPVKIYAAIVGHFLRLYDFKVSQKINYWIANSKNVQARIEKFYRRDSVVIYPPIEVEKIINFTTTLRSGVVKHDKEPYFLIVSRLVGAKGIESAISVFAQYKIKSKYKKDRKYKLKIVGESYGFSNIESQISNINSSNIEFVGRVSDEALWGLYAGASGFIALARDEDFGMTVVEAQAAGTPVIAFNGGGFKETVMDGVTGILINDTNEKTIQDAVKKLVSRKWDKKRLQNNAKKFSKERFIKEMMKYVVSKMK